jgi:hypothetical protein
MTNLFFYVIFYKNILGIFITFFLFSFETKKVQRIYYYFKFYKGITEKVYTYTISRYVIKF